MVRNHTLGKVSGITYNSKQCSSSPIAYYSLYKLRVPLPAQSHEVLVPGPGLDCAECQQETQPLHLKSAIDASDSMIV